MRKGSHHAPQAIEKLKHINDNRIITKRTRMKLSKMFIGKNNPFYGRKHSKETRRKMRKHHKGMTGKKMPKWFGKFISKTRQGNNNPNWGKPTSKYQKEMASKASKGSNNWNWKGGQIIDKGYILILKPNHPFANSKGYTRRSHLIMEKKLNRFLKSEERVHHINHIKDDDRVENLMLFASNSEHCKFHHPKNSKFGKNKLH